MYPEDQGGIVLVDPSYQELQQVPIGEWVTVVHSQTGFGYFNIRGKDCMISIEEEPTNINRGIFHAKLEIFDSSNLNIEPRDGWEYGRYYFDQERAKAEIEAWLKAWKQIKRSDRCE